MTQQELLGQVLPRYDIGQEIGRGAWGVVYQGWHRDLRRPVAIKQLAQAFGADPSVRDRFIAEAQLVASLEHPHIVPLFDFAERDGLYVIVMELATGSVWDRFEQQGMQTEEAVATVLASAIGLHYAHSRGLLHRDVKPDNILYSGSGTVKIADFGIAKALNQAEGARTATKSIMGSPAYMAPEQITGGELSAATDVYALGVVTYELLSGHLPFASATEIMAQLYQHVNEAPRSLAEVAPQVPAPLAEVTHRALSKDPADRPQSAEQFAVELAAAGAASFGAGWLERTGLAVMGSTAVIAATERAPTTRPAAGGTIVVRPDEIARLRHGQVHGEAPEAVSPDVKPTRRVGGLPSAAVGALAAVVVVVAVVLAVLLSGGGTEPVTAAERAAFLGSCDVSGIGDERCSCALNRAVDQLSPEVFRANLAVIVEPDDLIGAEFDMIFTSCVEDGS